MPYWQKISISCLCLFLILMIGCIVLQIYLINFHYEYKKFYQLTVTITCVILFQYIILEHIMHFFNTYLITKFTGLRGYYLKIYYNFLFTPKGGKSTYKYDELTFWKERIQFLKSHLELHFPHRNEHVNWQYKSITQELWLFVKYYVLLLIIIVWFRNNLLYYNNRTVRSMLTQYRFHTYGFDEVQTVDNLYDYINNTFVKPFNGSTEYHEENKEPDWLHLQLARLIGVVRLKQVRHKVKKGGMRTIYFTNDNFLPNWTRPNATLHYYDTYWRMHHPWLSRKYNDFNTWLFAQQHFGTLYTYWDDRAYIAYLARDIINNYKILEFLKENNWLDECSVALFIEFTLYNADSNIFTVCTILLEQTPFAMVVWDIEVNSAQLLLDLNDMSVWWWLLIFAFALQVIQFAKAMVLKAWYDPNFKASIWNWLDITIIFLTVLAAIVVVIRNYWVIYVSEKCEVANKLEYIDFRLALFLDFTLITIQAFLVMLSTIRIWRILQFARTFRLFTRTLYLAGLPLLTGIIAINIFLVGISLATKIINGSYTENFSRYFTSVTSIMSFSFGFNAHTSPEDLSHGGSLLGFLLYMFVMFVVAILLINLFIILFMSQFTKARIDRDKELRKHRLTYQQYLYAECPILRYRYKQCSTYHRNIYETNIAKQDIRERPLNIDALRMEHTQDITEILLSQMEILNVTIMDIQLEDNALSDTEIVKKNTQSSSKNLILKLKVFTKLKLFESFCTIKRIIKFLC